MDVLGTGVDRNYTFQNFQVTVPANSTDSSMDGSSTIRGKSSSTTTIVGGVLSGVILILNISLAFMHFCHRKSRFAPRQCDCEKEESQPKVVATHQDRFINPQCTLISGSTSAMRETPLNIQPVNNTSGTFRLYFHSILIIRIYVLYIEIVPFIISPGGMLI